jgi:hypothetical protein
MMNSESMADMLRAAMEKRQGGKNSFTMTGQYAGSVERDGDREYVVYESPNGEQIKVYGNWNEYAVSRDEQGRDMIADEDYPIVQNEDGEYVLDEVRHNENMDTAYEREPVERMARETEMESTQGASKIENLLEKLRDARGPRQLPGRFEEGGKLPGDKVGKMKKAIVRMLEGGASDKEINAAIEKSGLDSSYDFDWDNVQMTVTAKPKDGERFGPKDEGGQRGDMFAYGGLMDKLKKYGKGGSMKYENGGKVSRLNSLLDASQGTISTGEGRRIEQDDFFNVRVDGEGFTYFIGDDGDDAYVKTPNGQYMRFQRDELIQAMGDQSDMLSRRQEGQRVGGVPMGGPFSGRYGGQGASKTEDLLERLRDVKRRR